MTFIRRIQMKMVNARGATMALRAVKEPLTLESTNSTTHSTKFCRPDGHAGDGALGRAVKQEEEQDTQADRETHGIHVDGPEAHVLGLLGGVGQGPGAFLEHLAVAALITGGQLPVGQVLQVVLDVFRRGVRFSGHGSNPLISLVDSRRDHPSQLPHDETRQQRQRRQIQHGKSRRQQYSDNKKPLHGGTVERSQMARAIAVVIIQTPIPAPDQQAGVQHSHAATEQAGHHSRPSPPHPYQQRQDTQHDRLQG
jgi:hypothetical protein